MNIWDFLVIQPLSALLRFLYDFTRNYGVAMILLSFITKMLLLYFSARGKLSMMRQQRLVPKQKELERLHGKDKQKYNEALMKLYQDEGISPMGGCLWSLLPLPIFFALFAVVRNPLSNIMRMDAATIDKLKEFFGLAGQNNYYVQMDIAQRISTDHAAVMQAFPELASNASTKINFDFFPGFNLAPIPNLPWSGGWNWLLLIPILSCATAYLSQFISQRINGTSQPTQGGMKAMFLMMPLMSLWIGFSTPAAMGVYWTANNLFQILQDYLLTRHYKGVLAKEDEHKANLAARRKAAEEQQREEERLRRLEQGDTAPKHTSKKKQYRLKHDSKPQNRPEDR